jgi:hypothetical protein
MTRQDVGVHLACALGGAVLCAIEGPADAVSPKNIVLVHRAWDDGSGWKPVYEILVKNGYRREPDLVVSRDGIGPDSGSLETENVRIEPAAYSTFGTCICPKEIGV